jgi:hypothetical protein
VSSDSLRARNVKAVVVTSMSSGTESTASALLLTDLVVPCTKNGSACEAALLTYANRIRTNIPGLCVSHASHRM